MTVIMFWLKTEVALASVTDSGRLFCLLAMSMLIRLAAYSTINFPFIK